MPREAWLTAYPAQRARGLQSLGACRPTRSTWLRLVLFLPRLLALFLGLGGPADQLVVVLVLQLSDGRGQVFVLLDGLGHLHLPLVAGGAEVGEVKRLVQDAGEAAGDGFDAQGV